MKKFLGLAFISLIIGAILATTFIIADSKYDILSKIKSKFGNEDIIAITNDSKKDEYVYLSSMGDFDFCKYIDIKVPDTYYVPTREEVSVKYSVFTDTVVISNDYSDIIFQLYDINVENELENLKKVREEIVNNMKEELPDITFDTEGIISVGDKIIPIIRFITTYKEKNTYTVMALLEVNSKTMIITLNSAISYMSTQELFSSVIGTFEIK